jgi:hypothetical protein
MKILPTIFMLLVLLTSAKAGDIPVSTQPVTEIPLSTGTLYIPSAYRPDGDRTDIVMHFQGSPEVARDRFIESGRSAVLIAIYYPGLSEEYGRPFRGTNLFRKILGEASRRTADHFGMKRVKIRRIVLSSFSAGYGSLREILKLKEYESLITDVILADSLYAGYIKVKGRDAVNPDNMTSFVPLAKRAARGEVNMWVTYSSVVPPGYASTGETADFLIKAVGAKKVPASGEDPPGMKLIAAADKGSFHVRGYAGDTGEEHMRHFHALDHWLARTSLPLLPGVGPDTESQ